MHLRIVYYDVSATLNLVYTVQVYNNIDRLLWYATINNACLFVKSLCKIWRY